jgi:hypothetical protein
MGYDDDDDKSKGIKDKDSRKLTAEKMGLMTESELSDLQFRSFSRGRMIDIDSAQSNYEVEKHYKAEAQKKANAKSTAYDAAVSSYATTYGDMNGDGNLSSDEKLTVESNLKAYGTDINRYQ